MQRPPVIHSAWILLPAPQVTTHSPTHLHSQPFLPGLLPAAVLLLLRFACWPSAIPQFSSLPTLPLHAPYPEYYYPVQHSFTEDSDITRKIRTRILGQESRLFIRQPFPKFPVFPIISEFFIPLSFSLPVPLFSSLILTWPHVLRAAVHFRKPSSYLFALNS